MKQTSEAIQGIHKVVFDILDEIGVSQAHRGYNYLVYAIHMCSKSVQIKPYITKEVCPEIAKVFSTTPTGVERCMRASIERAFDVCSLDIIYKYFGNSIDPTKGKATVSQFIYTLGNSVYRRINFSE